MEKNQTAKREIKKQIRNYDSSKTNFYIIVDLEVKNMRTSNR
jgi:hypothetical protein